MKTYLFSMSLLLKLFVLFINYKLMWKQTMSASLEEAFYSGYLSELESILIKYWFYSPTPFVYSWEDIPF